MTYYEIAKLRERVLGSSANTALDTLLNNYGVQADGKIDDLIYSSALRHKRITALPILPLPADKVTQNLKDASTDLAASYYFRTKRQFETAKEFREAAENAIDAFVARLQTDSALKVVPF
jgi:hypothetical protein